MKIDSYALLTSMALQGAGADGAPSPTSLNTISLNISFRIVPVGPQTEFPPINLFDGNAFATAPADEKHWKDIVVDTIVSFAGDAAQHPSEPRTFNILKVIFLDLSVERP